ncbi:coiled-coil domain-containing protein 115 [Melitaea cinxia]|uniref:coiled-coil domain-containing protein 115 n=1 Tax=Melitaea cinxia TaxID=113334 RepID=UPI001E273252|nr:coiled-coil domain-containing protein 115 [Melitaea cinxia]
MNSEEKAVDMEMICDLLDKLVLQQLHLIEDKMCCELNIETGINNGCIHLAKSRYIMGQNSVSKERLPTESSPEFSASVTCDSILEDNVKQLKISNADTGSCVVNPLNWFGVLVPQNLHKSKDIFKNTVNYVVECVNIQLKILENISNIEALKKYKSTISNRST